jgi:hypothetical protein
MQMFVVRTGKGDVSRHQDPKNPMTEFTDSVEIAQRIPRQHAGWQSVTYKGKRYQLFGGTHVFWFICLNSPIKTKN